MITDILYRCPICGRFDWLEKDRCLHCGVSFRMPNRTQVTVGDETGDIAGWYERVLAFDLPDPVDGDILKSGRVRMSREEKSGCYRSLAGIYATTYQRTPVDEGRLALRERMLTFSGDNKTLDLPIHDIDSITIESNTVILVIRDHGPLFFDFLEESGKKWEDCIRKAIDQFHAPKKVLEYFPRLRLYEDQKRRSPATVPSRDLSVPVRKWFAREKNLSFLALRKIVRILVRLTFPIRILGMENIPNTGAAVVMGNHTSFLDGIILEMFPRRMIRFMTKNSQYKSAFIGWFLQKAGTFPVRRYTTDVLAIRNAIRIVQQGHLMGIFPEGERSWDGRMLPLKRGAVRLILALGVPVVPVGVSGAYGLMPRWTHSLKRVPATIRFGKPIQLDSVPIPLHTPELIDETAEKLKDLILEQMEDQK